MKTAQKRLSEIKEHGYELDFTVTFNHAIELYKKTFLMAGLTFLILATLIGAIAMGLIFNMVDLKNPQSVEEFRNFQLQSFSASGIVIYLFSMVALTALFAPINAGMLKMCYDAEMGKPVAIRTAFEYYKAPYFGRLVLAAILIAIASLGISLALELSGIQVVGAVISFLIGITTCMTMPLIVFGNLSATDAISGSMIVISRHPLTILGLIIVASIVACLGIIGCCIGIIFTFPIVNATYYSIYVHSVGIEENREIEEYS